MTRKKLNLTLEVKILGTDTWAKQVEAKPGDVVRYRIGFKNVGDATLEKVVIRDLLPSGLSYVAGSASIFNAAHPKGVSLSDAMLTKYGANIGKYATGANAWIYFNASVDMVNKDRINALYRNIVEISGGEDTAKNATADVLVSSYE